MFNVEFLKLFFRNLYFNNILNIITWNEEYKNEKNNFRITKYNIW